MTRILNLFSKVNSKLDGKQTKRHRWHTYLCRANLMSNVIVVPVSTWNMYSIFGLVKLLPLRRQDRNGQAVDETPLASGG